MTPRNKIRLALLANVFLLSIVSIIMFQFATDSPYFRFGPNDDFILIAVKIDDWNKYSMLLLIISFIEFTRVMIEDLGTPILIFNIYNPDKKVITDFNKNELQIYGNSMFLVNNLRYVFQILVTVTQLDIAIFSVLMAQISGIITIRFLLNEKKYGSPVDNTIQVNNLEDSEEIIEMNDNEYIMQNLI
jgi:hypothetical protein